MVERMTSYAVGLVAALVGLALMAFASGGLADVLVRCGLVGGALGAAFLLTLEIVKHGARRTAKAATGQGWGRS